MKADYVHKDSRTLEEKPQVFTRWIDPTIEELKRENQELKKQLEERPKEYVFIGNAQNKTRDFINQITKDNKEFKNQQKEFISYLENEIKECNKYSKYIENKLQELKSRSAGKTYIANEIMKNEVAKKCFTENLSKYKEIIEGKNENNMGK